MDAPAATWARVVEQLVQPAPVVLRPWPPELTHRLSKTGQSPPEQLTAQRLLAQWHERTTQ
jgi:hypothetical protein